MKNLPIIFLLIITFVALSCDSDEQIIQTKGKLFMVAGQSNAVGVGDKTKSVEVSANAAYEYDPESDSFIHLADPVGSANMGFQKAEDGSFIPAFAQAYFESKNETVYIVQAAKGGSSCHSKAETNGWGTWSETGSLFKSSVDKVRMAEKKSELSLAGIVWSQGENDGDAIAKGLITKSDYKMALLNLIQRYRDEFGQNILFGIIETGRIKNNSEADYGFSVVRQVQREVAKDDPSTYIVYAKTDKFMETNQLIDAVHYNQDALNEIGAEVAKNICIILNGLNVAPSHGAMVIAHRGASAFAPENTLAAVNMAWEMEASAVEIDIHLTKDNKIVVCHDSDTKRVSGENYTIATTDSEVLRLLDVGSSFSSLYTGEKIPFLDEVIQTVPKGKYLFVEIKCPEKVVPFLKEIIEKTGKQDQIKIISFSSASLLKVKELMPEIPGYWLVCPEYKPGIMYDLLEKSDSYGFDGLDINYGLLTPESNEILKEKNRYVYVWTVDNQSNAKRFDGYNVYGITTNNPDILK